MALAVGFRTHRFGWDGAGVSDGHFRLFGDVPPDVLGEEGTAEWSDTLKYLEGQLGLGKEEDSSGKQAAALETVVEAVHGFELTRIRRADEKDYAFRKREVVVKWLHLHAGY